MFTVENLVDQVTDKISSSLSNRLNIENLNISDPVTDSPTEGKKFTLVFILDCEQARQQLRGEG